MTTTVTRADLQLLKGISPKLVSFFEQLFSDTQAASAQVGDAVAATGAIQNATVITLSPNAAFGNERVLSLNPGQFQVVDGGPGGNLTVSMISAVATNGGFQCTFNLEADTNLDLPSSGRVPSSADGPYADDVAAAAAGVQIGEIYKKTGGVMAWRQA